MIPMSCPHDPERLPWESRPFGPSNKKQAAKGHHGEKLFVRLLFGLLLLCSPLDTRYEMFFQSSTRRFRMFQARFT